MLDLDEKILTDLWKGHQIPQANLNFDHMMSRKEQTVAINHRGLQWMFTKSSDQIARAIQQKAREDHIKENEDKGKRIDQIDWNTENNL